LQLDLQIWKECEPTVEIYSKIHHICNDFLNRECIWAIITAQVWSGFRKKKRIRNVSICWTVCSLRALF